MTAPLSILALLFTLTTAVPAFAQSRGAPMPPPVPTTGWAANAVAHRGHNQRVVRVHCPANGRLGSVWGTGLYTDDSSVCTAAVHAGVISVRIGGVVHIEIRPGAASYQATSRSGVTSRHYARWSGSFIVHGSQFSPSNPAVPGAISWSTNAIGHRGSNGKVVTLRCPANGGLGGAVWGDGVYTDDSSICLAAVHSGLISVAGGGTVNIEIRPGQPRYAGARHNGVNSRIWAAWHGSFVFVP